MYGTATHIRSLGRGISLALIGIGGLTACAHTREVAEPGPGHPASAVSTSEAFVPPTNLLAQQVTPADQPDTAHDEMGMTGMHHDSGNANGLSVYTCPMHADVRADRPGVCPKCGMKLVPSRSPDHTHQHGGTP